jgi:Flp pilus assembly pilin Flp
MGKDCVVRNLIRNFVTDEQAVAPIEYGLLAVGIGVAIVAVIAALGTSLNTTVSSTPGTVH